MIQHHRSKREASWKATKQGKHAEMAARCTSNLDERREKKKLKMHGVEARRAGLGKSLKRKGRAQITTKSGYERRLENKRRGALQGSQRRALEEFKQRDLLDTGENSEWGGIDE